MAKNKNKKIKFGDRNTDVCEEEKKEEGDREEEDEDLDEDEGQSYQDMVEYMLECNSGKISELPLSEVNDIINLFHTLWCSPDYDAIKLQERNLVFFGGQMQLRDRYRTFIKFMMTFDCRLNELKKTTLTPTENEILENCFKHLGQITGNITYGYESMVNTYRQLNCNKPRTIGNVANAEH